MVLLICIAGILLFFVAMLMFGLFYPPDPFYSPSPKDKLKSRCADWLTNWCMNHPGDNPTDYPTFVVKSDGIEYSAKCNDEKILGDMKCRA